MATHDYLIVGAGPAGVQMGYFLAQQNRRFTILEANSDVGCFFETHPRHSPLISINQTQHHCQHKDFAMRHDWNSLVSDDFGVLFKEETEDLFPAKEHLVAHVRRFAERYDIKKHIRFNCRVASIEKSGDCFVVTDVDGHTHRARAVLMATGAVEENICEKDIPGISQCSSYSKMPLAKSYYNRKKVLIIGKGNSAFEVADYITANAGHAVIIGRSPVQFAWETHFVGNLRAINNNFLDMVRLKSSHAMENWTPISAVRHPEGSRPRKPKVCEQHAMSSPSSEAEAGFDSEYYAYSVMVKANNGAVFPFHADEVIACTGWRYVNPSLFADNTMPAMKLDGRLPVVNESWESVNIKGLYFIGTNMQACDKQSASGFVHGFRYNIRTLSRMLDERYFDVAIPRTVLTPTAELPKIVSHIVDRISHASGLWQLYTFFCDVLISYPATGKAVYVEEVRKDWVLKNMAAVVDVSASTATVTLISHEFGSHGYGPEEPVSSFDLVTPSKHVACGVNIHPVFRAGSLDTTKSGLTWTEESQLHLRVTLDGHWTQPQDEVVLAHFIKSQFKSQELEPFAGEVKDVFKVNTPASSVKMVKPEVNAEFFQKKGYIQRAGFASKHPCILPSGSIRSGQTDPNKQSTDDTSVNASVSDSSSKRAGMLLLAVAVGVGIGQLACVRSVFGSKAK